MLILFPAHPGLYSQQLLKVDFLCFIHLILDRHEIDRLNPLCDICKVPSINRHFQGVPSLTSCGTECPKQVSEAKNTVIIRGFCYREGKKKIRLIVITATSLLFNL